MTEAESRTLMALADGGALSLQADSKPLIMQDKMSNSLEILLMPDKKMRNPYAALPNLPLFKPTRAESNAKAEAQVIFLQRTGRRSLHVLPLRRNVYHRVAGVSVYDGDSCASADEVRLRPIAAIYFSVRSGVGEARTIANMVVDFHSTRVRDKFHAGSDAMTVLEGVFAHGIDCIPILLLQSREAAVFPHLDGVVKPNRPLIIMAPAQSYAHALRQFKGVSYDSRVGVASLRGVALLINECSLLIDLVAESVGDTGDKTILLTICIFVLRA